MGIGEIITREVVIAQADMNVAAAARVDAALVGDLVLVREPNGRRIPVGIVTDRDIVVEVVAAGLDLATLTVDEISSQELITGREEDSIFDTLQIMGIKGVRRLPVVDDQGALLGIVTVDDLIEIFAEELTDLARVISRGRAREAKSRP